ncbi:MAG: S9 family peptidase, partial [Actinomycetota bacterium]|nr:S9 family peptidase [Actinomycetota bacterium]
MRYPDAHRLDLVDDLAGHQVADPYRWLEDAASPDTVAWSAAQDQLVSDWLSQLPGRDRLRARLRQLLPGYVGPPYVVGERRFFQRRLPDQDHAVLLVDDAGVTRVLVDPNELSADHTVTLDSWAPCLEGDLLAYQLSQGGDEESVLRIMDVATGELVDGPIDRVRYSPV